MTRNTQTQPEVENFPDPRSEMLRVEIMRTDSGVQTGGDGFKIRFSNNTNATNNNSNTNNKLNDNNNE